jgi:hypothetical protein
MAPLQPVLAFDLRLVIFMAFIAISVISWIIKQVNENKKPQPAPRRPQAAPRPRNDRIQQEIDQFLKDAANRRAPQPRADVLDVDDIEIVSPPPMARRPPPPRRPQPSTPAAPRRVPPAQASPGSPRRPGQELAGRHITTAPTLGQQAGAASRQRMDERVTAQAAQHLPHAVDQSVSQHLGVFAAGTPPVAGAGSQGAARDVARTAAASLLLALRSPAGVRQAVIMQEILQRPRALRR